MAHDIVPPRQRRHAKAMRRVMTDAELKLWNELRAHRLMNLGFRRQVPIGRYIVDFVCFERKLIVELDGGQHASTIVADQHRTAWLESQGFRVMRFWNNDVVENIEGVYETIASAL